MGCAHFPEFLENLSERHILWRMSYLVFHALTLKLPIQTSLSMVPKLPVSAHTGENKHIPVLSTRYLLGGS